MENSKKTLNNSLSQALSSVVNAPQNAKGSFLHFVDNPEQYYIHSNPRHCGLFYEHVMDNLQFEAPPSLKEINLRTLKKQEVLENVKQQLYDTNQNVHRQIIETSRYLWMIDQLLGMQIKAFKGFIVSLIFMLILLGVQIFVNISNFYDYYIGYIALGIISLLGMPLIAQNGILSFVIICCYEVITVGSIFYLCIFSQNLSCRTEDLIFVCLYSIIFMIQFYFFFYFEVKRRLLCYLLHHNLPN